MIAGRPTSGSTSIAASKLFTRCERGDFRPILSIASRKRRRSSALSMTSPLAPIISTPNFSSVPSRSSARPVLRAVCPPMVGSRASGRSRSITLATIAGVIGST